MADFRDFIEKAERDVREYFTHCPLCYAENSMEFEWGFGKDAVMCASCGAKWHINHGLAGFKWADLVKDNAEGRGAELLGKKKDPIFWQQMASRRQEGAPKQFRPIEETPEQVTPEMEAKKPWWWNPLKYFLHGIAFSVLFTVLAFVWIFILAILIALGSFIGLIIGLVVLFFFVGGLNTFLANLIWSIATKADWKSLLTHGFILFIVLVFVEIPSLMIGLAAPSLTTIILLFLAYAFINGFVAKKIAEYWEEEYEESD